MTIHEKVKLLFGSTRWLPRDPQVDHMAFSDECRVTHPWVTQHCFSNLFSNLGALTQGFVLWFTAPQLSENYKHTWF